MTPELDIAGGEVSDLNGKRIIVVEDDFLLAAEICQDLRNLGATVLGPAPTPFYAMQLIGRRKLDAAVLDVRLHGTDVLTVADLLQEQGVPIIFATAYERDMLPARFQEQGFVRKPLDRRLLIEAVVAMARRPRGQKVRAAVWPGAMPARQAPAQTFARALARTIRPSQG